MNESPPTVEYWAVSILTSRTAPFAGLTLLLGILSLPEVLALIPLRAMPLLLAAVGIVNLILRTLTVRPVAFIAPGETKAVAVAKIAPPDVPAVTD